MSAPTHIALMLLVDRNLERGVSLNSACCTVKKVAQPKIRLALH